MDINNLLSTHRAPPQLIRRGYTLNRLRSKTQQQQDSQTQSPERQQSPISPKKQSVKRLKTQQRHKNLSISPQTNPEQQNIRNRFKRNSILDRAFKFQLKRQLDQQPVQNESSTPQPQPKRSLQFAIMTLINRQIIKSRLHKFAFIDKIPIKQIDSVQSAGAITKRAQNRYSIIIQQPNYIGKVEELRKEREKLLSDYNTIRNQHTHLQSVLEQRREMSEVEVHQFIMSQVRIFIDDLAQMVKRKNLAQSILQNLQNQAEQNKNFKEKCLQKSGKGRKDIANLKGKITKIQGVIKAYKAFARTPDQLNELKQELSKNEKLQRRLSQVQNIHGKLSRNLLSQQHLNETLVKLSQVEKFHSIFTGQLTDKGEFITTLNYLSYYEFILLPKIITSGFKFIQYRFKLQICKIFQHQYINLKPDSIKYLQHSLNQRQVFQYPYLLRRRLCFKRDQKIQCQVPSRHRHNASYHPKRCSNYRIY